jgi:serine/threonine protein kinase
LPSARATALMADDGRYRIERELGRGGRGRVWLARDTVMDRAIAIKQPARRGELSDARFAREARITG